jgi:flagellar basal-body rod modification protein FlgD
MMNVSGIIDTPAAVNAATTATAATATDSTRADEDKFLKLLVTQLKNQDPLNPLDNAAMTSQLAQLSTVTGINKVNATLESLRSDIASTQSSTAISLIGKGVLVEGTGLVLSSSSGPDGKTSSASVFGIDLASAAQSVAIQIKDSGGNVVRNLSLTNAEAGSYPIAWDGTMDDGATVAPDGHYTFSVSATTAGSTLMATPLQLATVSSVSTGGGAIKLNTSLGHFSISDIKEVL